MAVITCIGTKDFPGCGAFVRLENHELNLCASCNAKRRDNDDFLYTEARRMYLAFCVAHDFTCPITGTPITMDSDIHHKKGRSGYADKWARDNDITLLIDIRFFLAVSREGHQWIEKYPKIAKLKGYSLNRLATHGEGHE